MKLINKSIDYFSISGIHHIASLLGTAFSTLYLMNYNLISEKIDQPIMSAFLLGAGILATGVNEAYTIKQYNSLRKLEKTIERQGYDPRLTKPFIQTYCGKGIVKRVLKKKGFSEEY